MPRNYHTLAAPKVYLSLLPADRCGEDFVIEGPDHPHFVLPAAPSMELLEAVMDKQEKADADAGIKDTLHLGYYQVALIAHKVGGDWTLHPLGVRPEWPSLDVEDMDEAVALRIKALRKLGGADFQEIQRAVGRVSSLSESESKNSGGGSSSPAEESQPPEPQN